MRGVDRQCDVIIVIDKATHFALQLLMRKESDRVSLLKWWRHGTCDHFVVFSFHEGVACSCSFSKKCRWTN